MSFGVQAVRTDEHGAGRSGRGFRFVTNDPGTAGYGLPCVRAVCDSGLSSIDVGSALVAALGYDYGPDHPEEETP